MRTFALVPLIPALALAAGCSSNSGGGGTGGSGAGGSTPSTVASTSSGSNTCPGGSTVQRLAVGGGIDKIDLVLMVDNSRSMADKQDILAQAIPDMIAGLVNPPCIDMNGNPVPSSMQPNPTGACPANTQRLFPPVYDIHIGLLSSSLGSFGADGCPDTTNTVCLNMAESTSNNDHGHLVTRTDPCMTGHVPTWKNEGFLAWDPKQMLNPPGESQVGDTSTPGTLVGDLHDLVLGDGQDGCGFESQNESWYRFLVDPSPYQTITLNGQMAQSQGIDNQLLQQRADFLRSDSLLGIVVVTDETDTSIKESGFYPLFAQELENGQPFHLPTARTECTTKGPLDPCCGSCGEAMPKGCPADPSCSSTPQYTDATENLALRAFGLSGGQMSHKARYGIEFFYPPSRYVQALTSPTVQNANGKTVPNPIFSPNPNEPGAAVRDPSRVIYATVTGVPWQLIARQKNGQPDLVNGVSSLDPTQVGGFKTYAELAQKDAHGNTFWDDIAGDPEHYVPPISPFMQESTVPRTGTDPITGISTSPPGTPDTSGNPINGHEWLPTGSFGGPPGDIQYACVFDLPTPHDCSAPGAVCDCDGDQAKDNPLCAPNPNDNGNYTLQVKAKAYPGVRNLAIAKGMRDQGIVASICAAQIATPTKADGTPAPDYGYRPAVGSIVDNIQRKVGAPQCFPRALTPNADGQVACTVIEASKSPTCDCNGTARAPVAADHQCLVDQAKQDPLFAVEQWSCFCEIDQTSGAALQDCETNADVQGSTNGFCYVDAATGSSALVSKCPSGEQQQLRFVGGGTPAAGSTVFLSCQ